MSIASRQRQAERDRAAGRKKPVASGSRVRSLVVLKPFCVTDEANIADGGRKQQIAANPHLRNRRRMFGNPLLTQKQRKAMAQLRREERQKKQREAKSAA
jgi:hypothetical protein